MPLLLFCAAKVQCFFQTTKAFYEKKQKIPAKEALAGIYQVYVLNIS